MYQMHVDIKSCIQWAKEAEGIAVVMDIFRASNTIISAMANWAEYIIPVGELEEAFALKKEFPDHLLFGERKGLIAPWCEYGNSPMEASTLSLQWQKIILTTSAWSQWVVYANLADEIIIGSFANADAVVKYITANNPSKVSLIAVGFNSWEIAEEDELCGQYIKAKLEWQPVDFEAIKIKMLQCIGADRLRSLWQDDDLAFCTQLNTYDILPVYDKKSKKIFCK